MHIFIEIPPPMSVSNFIAYLNGRSRVLFNEERENLTNAMPYFVQTQNYFLNSHAHIEVHLDNYDDL